MGKMFSQAVLAMMVMTATTIASCNLGLEEEEGPDSKIYSHTVFRLKYQAGNADLMMFNTYFEVTNFDGKKDTINVNDEEFHVAEYTTTLTNGTLTVHVVRKSNGIRPTFDTSIGYTSFDYPYSEWIAYTSNKSNMHISDEISGGCHTSFTQGLADKFTTDYDKMIAERTVDTTFTVKLVNKVLYK